MLFTQLFESDFNKKPLAEAIDDYEDCRYCSGTGEGRWEGSSCTHCRGTGVEPVSQDDDDFEEPDDVADMDHDEESYYEKSLRSRGLEEKAQVKKKDNDDLGSEIKDVALQRAISRAKADFPTAGSGIEALAKDFMRGQEQDQKTFDQIRQTERQQNQMLAQIDKIDQEQEQEINDLEDQNSTLSKRLQQLQNVNSQLEKKLAAMSGRKEKRRADKTEPAPEPTADIPVPTVTKAEPSSDAKAKEPEPTTSRAIGRMAKDLTAEPTKSKAIAQVAKSLSPSEPSAAIDQMAQQLQPRQKELGFDEPVTLKPKKFDTSKASDTKYRELTRRLAKDIVSDPNAAQAFKSISVQDLAGQQEMPVENKESSARIRAVKTPRADGSVETTYELVNAQGVTVKAGMSKETAQSHLKHYKQKHGQ